MNTDAVFAALADPTRRDLLRAVASGGPSTATELASDRAISRQAVTKHLAVLDSAGLVARERNGREVRYRADPGPLADASAWIEETGNAWDRRLDRLGELVAKTGEQIRPTQWLTEGMAITRLNHAVLYVRDVAVAREFYESVLGFETLIWMPGKAAFFRADGSTNDHDLGTFQIGANAGPSAAGQSTVGLYHLAWEVDTLTELKRLRDVLTARGSLVGATDHITTKALYAKDPDGIEFELSWLVPADRIDDELRAEAEAVMGQHLDLDGEIRRYGATTLGGIGVSIPA